MAGAEVSAAEVCAVMSVVFRSRMTQLLLAAVAVGLRRIDGIGALLRGVTVTAVPERVLRQAADV